MIPPFPSDTMAPFCTLLSHWTLYETFTHHLINDIFSTISFNFIRLVTFRYLSTLFNFLQSSSSGFLNLVVRNATTVWISLRALLHTNSICAVVCWKIWACSSGRYLASFSSPTLNKWPAAGDAAPPKIFSGKDISILPVYLIMWTLTDPYSE